MWSRRTQPNSAFFVAVSAASAAQAAELAPAAAEIGEPFGQQSVAAAGQAGLKTKGAGEPPAAAAGEASAEAAVAASALPDGRQHSACAAVGLPNGVRLDRRFKPHAFVVTIKEAGNKSYIFKQSEYDNSIDVTRAAALAFLDHGKKTATELSSLQMKSMKTQFSVEGKNKAEVLQNALISELDKFAEALSVQYEKTIADQATPSAAAPLPPKSPLASPATPPTAEQLPCGPEIAAPPAPSVAHHGGPVGWGRVNVWGTEDKGFRPMRS